MKTARKEIREIPCSECTAIFGQTAYDISRKYESCPECRKVFRQAPAKNLRGVKRKKLGLYEIVLPQTIKPHFDKKRGEWYMRVRTRKRTSDEPLAKERVWLGLGADASPESVDAAYAAAYARLQMNGASPISREKKLKKRKRIKSIRGDIADWKQGRDKNLGIVKARVTRTMYKVYLPDPKTMNKEIYFGRHDTRNAARKVRDEKYKELREQIVPCALCGVMPVFRKGQMTHFSSTCENRVQLPFGVRPLYQTKLWNMVFSTGESKHDGKLSKEDLYYMGYLFRTQKGGFYGRSDVEYNLTLAEKHARKRPEPKDEDVMFE